MPENNEQVYPPITHPISCQGAEEHHLADRYVLGQLAPDEVEAFEDHYVSCEACARDVDNAELMVKGLRKVAAQGLAAGSTPPDHQPPKVNNVSHIEAHRPPAHRDSDPRRVVGLLAAALVGAVLTLPLWFNRFSASDSKSAAVTVAYLQPERSTTVEPGYRIRASNAPIILALELTPPFYKTYRARVAHNGREVWSTVGLELGERNTVHVSLLDDLLVAGTYSLFLEGSNNDSAWFDASRFSFRVDEDPRE